MQVGTKDLCALTDDENTYAMVQYKNCSTWDDDTDHSQHRKAPGDHPHWKRCAQLGDYQTPLY